MGVKIHLNMLLFISFVLLFVNARSQGSGPFQVTQPALGSQLYVTRNYTILWNTVGNVPYVTLFLVRGNESHLIEYSQPNDGKCAIVLDMPFFVDTNFTANDWQIIVTNAGNSSQSSSSSHFTIIYPNITIAPITNWMIDDNETIIWNTTLGNILVDYVSIYLVNGTNEIPLANNWQNAGQYQVWGVRNEWFVSSSYQIRICWVLAHICGYSSFFSVVAPQFRITTPTNAVVGGVFNVSWSTANLVQSVNVYLNVPGIETNYLLCNQTENNWCSIYPLPFWIRSSSSYSAIVCWVEHPNICNESKIFGISDVITVQDIERIVVTDVQYQILWNTTLPLSTFSVALYSNNTPFSNGNQISFISNSVAKQGDIWWTPSSLNQSLLNTTYFLNVSSSTQQGGVSGVSNSFILVPQNSLAIITLDVQADSDDKIRGGDDLNIVWSISEEQDNKTGLISLPSVSIFLVSSDNTTTLLESGHRTSDYPWTWTIPRSGIAFNSLYSIQVCFEASFTVVGCQSSSPLNINAPFTLWTPMWLGIIGGGVVLVIIIVIVLIVRAVKTRRSRSGYVSLNADPSPSAPPQSAENGRECRICLENAMEQMIEPCGHICMCTECAERVGLEGNCPVCRGSIESFRRVYM